MSFLPVESGLGSSGLGSSIWGAAWSTASIAKSAGLAQTAALAAYYGLNRPGCGQPSRTLPLPLVGPARSPLAMRGEEVAKAYAPGAYVFAEVRPNVGGRDAGGGGKCFLDVGCGDRIYGAAGTPEQGVRLAYPEGLNAGADLDAWLLERVQSALRRHQVRVDFEHQRAATNINNIPLSFGVSPAVAVGATAELDEAASCAARISDAMLRKATLEAVALGAPAPVGSQAERAEALRARGAPADVAAAGAAARTQQAAERVAVSLAASSSRLDAILTEQFGLRNPLALRFVRFSIYALGAFAGLSAARAAFRWAARASRS